LAVPDTLVLEGLAAGDDAAADDAGADEDDDEDEDDEELHAAAVKPRHAMPSTAAARLLDDRNVSMKPTIATYTCVPQ
jgi:hypothetical protein